MRVRLSSLPAALATLWAALSVAACLDTRPVGLGSSDGADATRDAEPDGLAPSTDTDAIAPLADSAATSAHDAEVSSSAWILQRPVSACGTPSTTQSCAACPTVTLFEGDPVQWTCGASGYCVTPGTAGACLSTAPVLEGAQGAMGRGSGVSDPSAAPPSDVVIPADALAREDAVIWIDFEPCALVGGPSFEVRALITERATGRRVSGQQVTFVVDDWVMNQGQVFGVLDGMPPEGTLANVSPQFPEPRSAQNLARLKTGPDGIARVQASVTGFTGSAPWLIDKPAGIIVSFDVDGASPWVEAALCARLP